MAVVENKNRWWPHPEKQAVTAGGSPLVWTWYWSKPSDLPDLDWTGDSGFFGTADDASLAHDVIVRSSPMITVGPLTPQHRLTGGGVSLFTTLSHICLSSRSWPLFPPFLTTWSLLPEHLPLSAIPFNHFQTLSAITLCFTTFLGSDIPDVTRRSCVGTFPTLQTFSPVPDWALCDLLFWS